MCDLYEKEVLEQICEEIPKRYEIHIVEIGRDVDHHTNKMMCIPNNIVTLLFNPDRFLYKSTWNDDNRILCWVVEMNLLWRSKWT